MDNFGLTISLDLFTELSDADKNKVSEIIQREANKISPLKSFSTKELKSPRSDCVSCIDYKLSFVTTEKLNREEMDGIINMVLNTTKDYDHAPLSFLMSPIKD